jgi:anhydro-N-acetylmuramic acid kinase
MNKSVEKLYNIAGKEMRTIIGLMSGTSLDGLDIALCQIKNHGRKTKIELINFETVSYNETIKSKILKVFAKKEGNIEHLCLLNPWIAELHGSMILQCLKYWGVEPSAIDLIASHGQTIYHAPKNQHKQTDFPNATMQLGDGDHLAMKTGIITISDFRQKNIAAGGEGAPLAVYADYLIFADELENRILLNIGGIGNFTYLPAGVHRKDLFTTDTGPGNTLIDQYVRSHYGIPYDDCSNIAKQGKVNYRLLETLKSDPFFQLPFPKTTGPEVFNLQYLEVAIRKSDLAEIKHEDVVATLTKLSAVTIAQSIYTYIKENDTFHIYMSGGGKHNPLMVEFLKELLPNCIFSDTNALGINPDAKEAVLFALLANECVASDEIFQNNDDIYNVTMGKISFPK